MTLPATSKVPFGGDYNPEQRPEEVWQEDHRLFDGLMEQTPSYTASRDVNPLTRPGVMRLWSWQAVAHGADAVLFFQMRASRDACEKYHGAVIGHVGRDSTRVFREVASPGAELDRLGAATLGARTPARVALLFDWDSWWALLLNHRAEPVEVTAHSNGTDLLSGDAVECGQPIRLDPHGVLVLRTTDG